MFFSSIQSFVGNGGQANYAAACGFKDSFALHLRKAGNLPVKIINWGYWGSVGVASSEEHNRIMASKGMLSIQPEEGMEAIERILAEKAVSQVIVLKAKPFLLKQTDIIDNAKPEKSSDQEAEQVNVTSPFEASNPGGFDKGRNNNNLLKHLKVRIVQCIAEVLKVEAGEVDNSTSFSDYGVDSITGMELIDCINNEFDLTLKTTILFDYSNVDDLAGYLETELGQEAERQIQGDLRRNADSLDWNADSRGDIDLHQTVTEKLIACITDTLKVNREDIDFTMQFSEYGVDSITGVSLLKSINDAFGIVLKNTVLFDYSNIQSLSEYLCREYDLETEAALTSAAETFDNRRALEADPLELLAKGILNVEEVMEMISGRNAENPA